MWVKQCHKPPMAGGLHQTTYKNGDGWGMDSLSPDKLTYPLVKQFLW